MNYTSLIKKKIYSGLNELGYEITDYKKNVNYVQFKCPIYKEFVEYYFYKTNIYYNNYIITYLPSAIYYKKRINYSFIYYYNYNHIHIRLYIQNPNDIDYINRAIMNFKNDLNNRINKIKNLLLNAILYQPNEYPVAISHDDKDNLYYAMSILLLTQIDKTFQYELNGFDLNKLLL